MKGSIHPISSEEDVRTKVVTAWLSDCGFGANDISIEVPFKIRFGRQVFYAGTGELSKKPSKENIFRPRADVLVRSRDGRNLLIVEVKAPDEPLDDNARSQGISYARLLDEGGIAPFVVITNGREAKIYDSFSREMIRGSQVPSDHPHVRNGFRISADDLTLRWEAIEALVSLSPENLIEYCRAQVSSRMRILRGDDPYSGKKYIPSLYIERSEAKKKVRRFLDSDQRRVVCIEGPPQVGKTNFICHLVEERLDQGLACLFYPAIGMQQGLLQELAEDFEWIMGENISPYHFVHNRLARIAHQAKQRIVIFIDGWNETSINLAHSISNAGAHLTDNNIQLVISFTDIAEDRLLRDDAGNPSPLAELAEIDLSKKRRIRNTAAKQGLNSSEVFISAYAPKEMRQAYSIYARVFNVQVPHWHDHVSDPFLLRVAMELYQGKILPDTLDEAHLIERSIEEKILRATKMQSFSAKAFLLELADVLYARGAPVLQEIAVRRWGLPVVQEVPDGLFEAGLLAKVRDQDERQALDFYFTRERDFVTACWARGWGRKFLESNDSILDELQRAIQTEVGTSALRWFLRQPGYRDCLRQALALIGHGHETANSGLVKTIIQTFECLFDDGPSSRVTDDLCEIATLLIPFLNDQSQAVRMGATLTLVAIDPWGLSSEVIMVIIRNLPREVDEFPSEEENLSTLSSLLEPMLIDEAEVNQFQAAVTLGLRDPHGLLILLARHLASKEEPWPQISRAFREGLDLAVEELETMYYGDMCPGALEYYQDDPEALQAEYEKMLRICSPILIAYYQEGFAKKLLDLLKALEPEQASEQETKSTRPRLGDIVSPFHQPPLPF